MGHGVDPQEGYSQGDPSGEGIPKAPPFPPSPPPPNLESLGHREKAKPCTPEGRVPQEQGKPLVQDPSALEKPKEQEAGGCGGDHGGR